MSTMTHWKRLSDFRIQNLRDTVDGLEFTLQKLRNHEWHDGGFFIEAIEPIYGLVFISLQHYINSTIFDLTGSLDTKEKGYKLGKQYQKSTRTEIELIIAVANYFKHRDDNKPLSRGTAKIFDDINMPYDDSVTSDSPENMPILKTMEVLSQHDSLNDLIEIVLDWRLKLFDQTEPKN